MADSASGIKTTYYYDFTDRLMKYVEKGADFSHSVGYAYDTDNNLTAVSETTNGVTRTTGYAYDDDNRVTTVTAGGSTKSYTYDAYGRVATKTVSINGTPLLTETFTYVSPSATATSGQIHTHTVSYGTYSTTYTYTYDDNGNITSIADGSYTITYGYDSSNQLIYQGDPYSGTYSWEYDDAGNIVACTAHGRVNSYTYGDGEWGDLYTSYDFDAIGNTEVGYFEYTWEHGRQLASAYDFTTYRWDYTYNADGIRTSRTNGTTTYKYVYNGSQLTSMTVGNNVLYFTYDDAGRPFMLNCNGVDYYYVTNIQGDVVAIIDTTGEIAADYLYNAWGEVTESGMNQAVGSLNPLLYRGYVYDRETRLYYLNSRYYEPMFRRFISPDAFVSTGQGLLGNNMYAYCNNNPVNFVDRSGKNPEPLAWWTGSMSWLPFVDTALPIGDVIYVGGIIVLGAIALATSQGNTPQIVFDEADMSYGSPSPNNNNDDDDDDDYYDDDSNFGGRQKVGKNKGNTPGNNKKQNKQFNDATKGILNKDQQRALHDEISGEGFSFHEIVDAAKNLWLLIIGLFAVDD